MALLREHDEAGPLLRRLEDWLHRPAGTAEPVDVAALLEPYQAIPADEPRMKVGDTGIRARGRRPSAASEHHA